jgi:hypothetical protein
MGFTGARLVHEQLGLPHSEPVYKNLKIICFLGSTEDYCLFGNTFQQRWDGDGTALAGKIF